MEPVRYFVFGKKTKVKTEGVIFIDKDGDYPSLEKYLEKEHNYSIYDFTKNHLHIDYFSSTDVFISQKSDTSLKIRLQNPLIPGSSLVIVDKKNKIDDIISKRYEYTEDYQIFSGDSIKNMPKKVKLDILKEIVLLSNVMYQMIGAGYLDLKNTDRIDDWIVMFQEPILDLFIRYHKFPTSASDISIPDEYVINPDFRKTILVSLMKILANFIVNNEYVDVSDVSDFESWENPELWSYLKENVKIFNV